MKPSERFGQDAELLSVFRNAYVDLVNNARETEGPFFTSELGPAVDNQTWQTMRSAVAASAGAAALAYSRHGGVFTLRSAAYIVNNVDPVTNWEMSLHDPEQLSPERVISSVESAIARARQEAFESLGRERGLTGLIAAFLRWPTDLREAVGAGHPAQLAAAGVIGVIGQILTAAIGGAISVGIVAAAVALWQLAF